jgi:predicted KAP-like P-loop ATPase
MSEFQGLGEDLGLSRLSGAAIVCLTGVGSPAIVEEHLRRLGALHVEGCGAHEDHHMFSIEEVEEAVHRVRELAADDTYSHACILLTEKDYARQSDLWSSVFARYANEVYTNSTNSTEAPRQQGDDKVTGGPVEEKSKGPRKWGSYVLHSKLEIAEHDRRFSSQKAVLAAMLRYAIDNYRKRSYVT